MDNVELITRENYLYLDDDCRRTYNTYSHVKIHPAFAIKNFSTSRLFKFLKKDKSYNSSAMTDLIIYGEYPIREVYPNEFEILEEAYKKNKLSKTGKKYTFNKNTDYSNFEPIEYEEYVSEKGFKYIRFFPNKDISISEHEYSSSSEKKTYLSSKPVWIEVKLLEWVYSEKDDILIECGSIRKTNLFNYLKLFPDSTYMDSNSKNNLKNYLSKYFLKEILSYEYYLLEEAFNNFKINDDSKIIDICIDIVKDEDIYNLYNNSITTMTYYLKDKYPTLTEEECNSVIAIILKVQSKLIPSYVGQQKQESKVLVEQQEINKQIKKELEERQEDIYNQQKVYDNLVFKIVLGMPKNLNASQIKEYVSNLNLNLSEEGLKKVVDRILIIKVKEMDLKEVLKKPVENVFQEYNVIDKVVGIIKNIIPDNLDYDHINEYVHSLDLTEEETNKIMKNFISRKEHEQEEESQKTM